MCFERERTKYDGDKSRSEFSHQTREKPRDTNKGIRFSFLDFNFVIIKFKNKCGYLFSILLRARSFSSQLGTIDEDWRSPKIL